MLTEDYLMRMISQALAALMTAIGLKKSGKYSEALQAIEQAVEQLTTLPASLIDQMDEGSILTMLTTQGQLDIGRLAILADLYQEQGEILFNMDRADQAKNSFEDAFLLEELDQNNQSRNERQCPAEPLKKAHSVSSVVNDDRMEKKDGITKDRTSGYTSTASVMITPRQ